MVARELESEITPTPNILRINQTGGELSPLAESASVISRIMQPDQVEKRNLLRQSVTSQFSAMPFDLLDRTVYLAATGQEVRTLFPDLSKDRIQGVRWVAIEELAKDNKRLENGHALYNDGFRQNIHNGIAENFPENVRAMLTNQEILIDQKDAVIERLYEEFPYFNDLLKASKELAGFDEATEGSLKLLFYENRIANLHLTATELATKYMPDEEMTIFDKGLLKKLDRKIEHATRRYEDLESFSLPNSITVEGSSINVSLPSPILIFRRDAELPTPIREDVSVALA